MMRLGWKSLASFGALYKVSALSVVLTLGLASAAFADQVTNRVDTSPDAALENVTLNEGATQSVAFRVISQNSDGDSQCNIDAGEQLIVQVISSNTSAATVSPQTLTFTACNQDQSLTLTAGARGTSTITATQALGAGSNTTGIGTFDYIPANFTVTVNNVAPTISNIPDQSTSEDNPTGAIPFTVGDAGTPAGNLTVSGSSSNTTLVPNSNISFGGSGANRTVTVTPEPNRSGTATVTVSVGDGAATTTDTFVLTVNATNDSPNAVDDTANANESGPDVTIGVLSNDSDVDGDTLTVTSNTQPPAGEGSVTCSATNCTYTPSANFNGTTSFDYTISDGNGGTDTATVTVNVAATNDAPAAGNDSYSVDEDQTLNVGAPGILGNDTDVDLLTPVLTAAVVDGPNNGTLTLNANGSFTYTPDANYNGADSFTYEVCDDAPVPLCDGGAVNIAVSAVNDPPTAGDNNRVTDEDVALTFLANELTANDSPGPADEQLQNLVVTEVGDAQHGTIGLDNGQITFTPATDYDGNGASFSYTVCDDGTTGGVGLDPKCESGLLEY